MIDGRIVEERRQGTGAELEEQGYDWVEEEVACEGMNDDHD